MLAPVLKRLVIKRIKPLHLNLLIHVFHVFHLNLAFIVLICLNSDLYQLFFLLYFNGRFLAAYLFPVCCEFLIILCINSKSKILFVELSELGNGLELNHNFLIMASALSGSSVTQELRKNFKDFFRSTNINKILLSPLLRREYFAVKINKNNEF